MATEKKADEPRVWELDKDQEMIADTVGQTLQQVHLCMAASMRAQLEIPEGTYVTFDGQKFTEVVGD